MLGRAEGVVEGIEESSDGDSQKKSALVKTASPVAELK